MAVNMKVVEVLLVVAIAAVGVTLVAEMSIDSEPVDFEIVIDGEGYTDPVPGVYSVKKGAEVTVSMTAEDGWLLSTVTVNGDEHAFGERTGEITVTAEGDTSVVVHFITHEVPIPMYSEFVYDGSDIVAYGDNQFYTVRGGSAKDAGSYTATLSLRYPDFCHWSDGTTGDKIVAWKIVPRQISVSDFEGIDDYVYTGARIEPVPEPLFPLVPEDFTVVYGDNKNVGTGTVEVTARNNHTGSVVLEFLILKKGLDVIVEDAEIVYGGAIPRFDHRYDGFVTGEDESVLDGVLAIVCDYVPGSSDAGEYVIVASGLSSDNYEIRYIDGVLTVLPYELEDDDFIVDVSSEMYDGKPHVKDVDAVPEFIVMGSDAVVRYMNNVDASTDGQKAQVIITGDGTNCVGLVIKEFTITKRDIKLSSPDVSVMYDGNAHGISADDITIGGSGLADGHELVFSNLVSEINAGVYENSFSYAFVQDVGRNYSVTTEYGTLTISKIPTSIVVTADSSSKKYDGTPLTDSGYSYSGALVSGDTLVVTIEGTVTDCGPPVDNVVTSVKVMRGDLDVTVSYDFGTHVDGKLEVTPRPVTLTSGSASKFYDGTPLIDNGVYVGGDGFVTGQGATYTFGASITFFGEVDNEFTYTLNNGTKASNYEITKVVGNLSIKKVQTTIVIESNDAQKDYDGTELTCDDYTFTSSVLIGDDRLYLTFTGGITDVGKVENSFGYVIKNSNGRDVTDCYTTSPKYGTLEVIPHTIVKDDFAVTSETKVYDGTGHQQTIIPNRTFLKEGVTYTVSYTDNVNAGTATITIKGKGPNCEGTLTYQFTISEREVTLTSDNREFTCDGTEHKGSVDDVKVTAGSFVTGDVLGYTMTGSQTTIGSSPNSFDVEFKDAVTGNNYSVTKVFGKLTVKPVATITITADSSSKVYDGTELTDSGYAVEGDLNDGDVLTVNVEGSRTDVGSSENVVSSYTIVRDGKDVSSHYTVVLKKGALTVQSYVLGEADFEPIGPMNYIGNQLRPEVHLTDAASALKLYVESDCSVTYGDNDDLGIGMGKVFIQGKGNAKGNVTLSFDIYAGVKVLVTQDGSGRTYPNESCPDVPRLSEFGETLDPLYDTSSPVTAGFSQTAKMHMVYHKGLNGTHLGVTVKDLALVDPDDGTVNELHKRMVLKVKVGDTVIERTLESASQGIIDLGEITGESDIPLEVTLELPSDADGPNIQNKTLDFKLVVCVTY